jgi:hypothetical protein
MPVAVAFAVVSGLLLLWMFALTRHAWRTLPPGAQIPVHRGLGGWNRWQPKESALVIWAVGGVVVWLATAGTSIYLATDHAAMSKGNVVVLPAALTLPMVALLVSERSALKAARGAGTRA